MISRYHGGASVVFSQELNPQLRSIALTGSFASVIGGGPAAAVVFPVVPVLFAVRGTRVWVVVRRIEPRNTNTFHRVDTCTRLHRQVLR